MKQKLKSFYLLVNMLLAGILLFSCSLQEDELQQFDHDKKLLITRKKLSHLFKEEKFKKSYEKLPKRKLKVVNTFGRTVMEEQYGFTITSQYANEAAGDSITSYTLAIKRDTITTTHNIENLVIQVNNYTSETEAFILKYISQTPITTFVNFTGEKEVTPIVYNSDPHTSTTSRVEVCFRVEVPCSNPNTETHIAGGVGCDGSGWSTIECLVYSESNVIVTTPIQTTAGTSPGGTPVITTVPNLPEFEEAPEEPCEELKKQLNGNPGNPNLKQAIQELQPNTSLNHETGKQLIKNDTGVYSSPDLPIGDDKKIKVNYGADNYGSIHVHTLSGVSMFSFEDVFSLKLFYDNIYGQNIPDTTIILICENQGVKYTYALKIDDPQFFTDMIINDLALAAQKFDLNGLTDDEIKKTIFDEIEDKLTKYYANNNTTNIDNEGREIAFLSRFANFGISLYKANNDLTNWSKLNLQKIADQTRILSTPCN